MPLGRKLGRPEVMIGCEKGTVALKVCRKLLLVTAKVQGGLHEGLGIMSNSLVRENAPHKCLSRNFLVFSYTLVLIRDTQGPASIVTILAEKLS